MKSIKLFATTASAFLILVPAALSETVSEVINLTANLEVQPSVSLQVNSDLTASVDGTESGTVSFFQGDQGISGATGCMTAPPGSLNITLDSANPSSVNHFALQATGLASKIRYVPSLKLRQPGGSFASVYSAGFSGTTTSVDLSSYDVDETDCASKPSNLLVGAFMYVDSTFSGDSAGIQEVIDAEGLADGQLYKFGDTLTVTIEPVL